MLTTVSRIRAIFLALLAVPLLLLTGFTAPASAGPQCAAVHVVAVPGSNETHALAGMNTALNSVLAKVTRRITKESDQTIKTSYVPYPAKLFSFDPHYFQSKDEGYGVAWTMIRDYHQRCPGTQLILLGYSQGAHIAGDLAATIASEGTPVPAHRLRGVHLLADPARAPHFVPLLGMRPGGLGGVLGHRSFGSVNDRVVQYCVTPDPVCNGTLNPLHPTGVGATAGRAALGVHTRYNTIKVPGTGKTFTERIQDDMINQILLLNDPQF